MSDVIDASAAPSAPAAPPSGSDAPASTHAPGPDSPAPETAAQAARRFKLKDTGGKELELDEAEAIRLAQKGLGADRRFEEAARMRREYEEWRRRVGESPKDALREAGHDWDQLVEREIQERIRLAKMSPEERAKHEIEVERGRLKAERDAWERQQREERTRVESHRLQQHYHQVFSAALTEAKLPVNPETIGRMAAMVRAELNQGLPVDPTALAQRVRQKYLAEHKALMAALNDDEAVEVLTKERLDRIRAAAVAAVKKGQGQVPPPPAPPPARPRNADGTFAGGGRAQDGQKRTWDDLLGRRIG